MTRVLRPYQREAVEAVYRDWEEAPIPTAIVLPTGTGKTDILARHCVDEARRGGRTLVLANALELLTQVTERVRMHDAHVSTGYAQGSRIHPHRQVIAGMVQTLQHERRRLQLLRPTKVIVDECDLATAPMYQEVLRWAGCYDGTPTFGVTATMAKAAKPKRGEPGLGDVWPRVAYQRDIEWAVDRGYLVKPRGKTVVVGHLDLSKAKTRGGDYSQDELGEMVSQDVPEIVAGWLEHGEGRLTAAIWPTIAAAEAGRDAFEAAGVKSELITGKTSDAERGSVSERTGIYGRFALGVTRMLHLVGVGIRGWDCPPIECILWARPTKSTPLYQQGVGRGLRPLDPAEWPMHPPKRDCLVLDVVGASRVNGLATLLELYRNAHVDDDRPAPPVPICRGCTLPVTDCPNAGECEREAPPERREKPRPEGPVSYVEHDLFKGAGLHWQTTRRKGRLFLAAGDRYAVLWPELDGTFTAAHFHSTATTPDPRNPYDFRELRPRVDLAEAKLVAEAWARTYAASDLASRAAERGSTRPAPAYLVNRAAKFKISGADRMTAARVREEIDRAIATSRLDIW